MSVQVSVRDRKDGHVLRVGAAVSGHPGELAALNSCSLTFDPVLMCFLSAGEGDPGSDSGSNQRAGRTDSEGSSAHTDTVSIGVRCSGL